ncbi:hypothetical protein PtA15_6A444 [Puccinia triticina]|uniref:Uncharacterized protein n=1 Tax=Puccinia triticina TaxID=208348 RepID=A0ABY7CM82_9BASI|nr:uncharacterized protein PtA15_6A444 [Puccinia triticina]WAQ85815.1 hypothetical protein PtA15_6A444 [Puccinia triticina]
MTGAERDAAAQRDPRQVWARTGLNGGQGGQGLDYLQAGAQAMQPGALGGAIRACDPGGRRVWDRHAHAGPLPPARLGLLSPSSKTSTSPAILTATKTPPGSPPPLKNLPPLDKQKDDVASPSFSSLSTSSANASCAAGGARRINSFSVINYFELAAKLGGGGLGLCKANGKGTKKDLKLAAKYYRMAANQGMEMMGSQWVWKDKVRPSPSLPSQ